MRYKVQWESGTRMYTQTRYFDSYEDAYRLMDSQPGARMYSNGEMIHRH